MRPKKKRVYRNGVGRVFGGSAQTQGRCLAADAFVLLFPPGIHAAASSKIQAYWQVSQPKRKKKKAEEGEEVLEKEKMKILPKMKCKIKRFIFSSIQFFVFIFLVIKIPWLYLLPFFSFSQIFFDFGSLQHKKRKIIWISFLKKKIAKIV